MTTVQIENKRATVHGNPWHPSFRGVALVTRIELLRRRPSPKGYIFYGVILALILTLWIVVAANSGDGLSSVPLELLLVLVLGTGLLIGPSLSATSINGDSSEGVLAPLQMTRLTAGDLAFGKLLASWAVSIAALVTTTPLMVFAYGRSGWRLDELAIALGVILLLVLMATAIGLAWSAIAARAVASVSLAHLTTGALVLGTLLVFAFTAPLVSDTVTVTNREYDWAKATPEQQNDPTFDPATLPCVDYTYEQSMFHSEQTAWLLLINPAVVIAESSPIINPETFEEDGRAAPGLFALIHTAVSGARMGPTEPQPYDACAGTFGDDEAWQERQLAEATMTPAPWPGLVLATVLLAGSMTLVVRRLRVPYKKLRAGSRVA